METQYSIVEKILLFPSKDEERINAEKLANAAPELLEALIIVYNDISVSCITKETQKLVKIAINKATK